MIFNGRAHSAEMLKNIREEGGGATISVIVVAPSVVTQSYLSIKKKAAEAAGMTLNVIEIPPTATTEEVAEMAASQTADAVVVQLPLPAHMQIDLILDAIPPAKDADVLSSLAKEQGHIVAPVAAAVEEILISANVPVKDARAVIIGKGRLVGEPVTVRLTALGASVSSYDEHTFSPEVLKDAQIIVSGAGVPHLITPDMLTPGVALIDAGTSEQNGALVGDMDPACAEIASVYTPVPGGVGPVTVACLMRNVVDLRKANIQVH